MILQIIFWLILCYLLARFWMQLNRCYQFNRIYSHICTVTNFVVKPIESVVPTRENVNWACLILIILVQLIQTAILTLAITQFDFIGLVIVALGQLLTLNANIFMFTIFCQAILSWFGGMHQSLTELQEPLYCINAPLLRPIQRFVPLLGGIDLSPLIMWFGLFLFKMYIAAPVTYFGLQLMIQ